MCGYFDSPSKQSIWANTTITHRKQKDKYWWKVMVQSLELTSSVLTGNFLCLDVYFRQELSEERTYREALRMKSIVPYFHPENISLHQVKYIKSLWMNVSRFRCVWFRKRHGIVACFQSLLGDQTHDVQSFSVDLPLLPKSDSPEALIPDAPEKNSKLS